ncbi:MAG: SIMPL domain-containing protein [Clostridiales bacterium]|jgi:uncharacterized protein YggE|nr:SIMPL domain-containing protein [Clostridiales bacterium]
MKLKKPIICVAALIAAGASAVWATGLTRVDAAEGSGKITVTGYGSINAKPDIAYVNVGCTNQNADPKLAQTANTAQMEKIIAAIKDMGIAEKDIQTVEYNIYPQTDYQNDNRITGYTVSNTLKITVRNLEQTGEVLEKAVDAGANSGGGIQFTIADSSAYYEQAMDLAIKNAISKAGAIGKSLSVTIGRPVEIQESGGSYTPVLYGNANMKLQEDAAAAVPIQSGDLAVSANITAVFEY